MEKDLKDKKQEEKNTPKIPWTKLVPAAAVIAALVFSGIKAKGSDGETEAVGQAETTVMSASELRKTVQQKRKAHRKKVQKKQQRKKAQVQERFPNLQKAMPAPQDREPRRHR